MLENIEGINDLGPLLNLINTYIRYYDEYANIQTLFKERKFEINDMVSLKEFDKVYHNFIKELFSNASRIHEHIDILSRLIDFLIQIKKLDYTWLITDAEKNKLNEQDWLSLDNVNNYFYKIKNNFKDMSQMRHYVFDFLIGAITLISQFKFSVTGTNKLQAYTLLINAFGELLGHFIICQKTLYDAAQCSLADFIDKMLEPLRRMTKNIKDMDMLEHKCQLIQRYFLFTQRLGQMTIEEALEAFQKRGTSIQESQVEALKKAYEVIDECYKSSLDTYILCKTPAERSRFIMGKLDNLNILIPQEKLSQWSHEQRKEYIPQMLAIVVLILSLIESGFLDNNDKVSLDYFLKPHCVQILGILKLLAIDTESDIQNHIAEILTGQGKSWALAMIAVLFALTGEEVVIACYSENLTSRDQKSMERFFKALNVFDKIKYKTF